MTLLEQFREFFGCVGRGGHSFANEEAGSKCLRCSAPKGGETIVDLFKRLQTEATKELPDDPPRSP